MLGDMVAEGMLSKLNGCFSKEDPDTCRTEQGAAGDVGGGGVSEGLEDPSDSLVMENLICWRPLAEMKNISFSKLLAFANSLFIGYSG